MRNSDFAVLNVWHLIRFCGCEQYSGIFKFRLILMKFGIAYICELAPMVGRHNNKSMTNIKAIYLLALLTFSLTACGQTKGDRTILGKEYAEQELKSLLTDKSQHNVIDGKTVIVKDSLTAINIAEPILFSIYGKDNITEQRPYEIYFIDNYWLVTGTLPSGRKGGTFLIIIDSRDCKIIRITHGK